MVRLVLENGLKIGLSDLITTVAHIFLQSRLVSGILNEDGVHRLIQNEIRDDLLAFFHDRLKVYLRDQGIRHDVIDAVLSPEADDLLAISRRAGALQAFLETEDGTNLLAGFKRAANILKAEEKKFPAEALSYLEPLNETLLADPAEKALADALSRAASDTSDLILGEDYAAAMQLLSTLRAPTDAFFTDIMVNDENPSLRLNRLRLLNALRAAVLNVADFSKIVG